MTAYDLSGDQRHVRWQLILRQRDMCARRAGSKAYHASQQRDSNPHAFLTASWANWDYGWTCEAEAES